MRILLTTFLIAAAFVSQVHAVSLMNGSVLSMNGLNLTVSGCSLTMAGAVQSSCSAAHVALTAVTSHRGSVNYVIAGDGTAANGTDVFNAVGGSGLYSLNFTLAVATNQPGSTVSAATLSVTGADDYACYWGCSSSISAKQTFSAAAGNKQLAADLLTAPSVNTVLSHANAFTINETLALNSNGFTQYEDCGSQPETLKLSSVAQTLSTVPEPASIALLLTGLGGIALARRRSRS